ncbi:hypothetical protein L7F22_034222 [Adiantum nelumboides]|nr:hypothetical protein [Adiantum nelumboides]
MSVFLDDFSVFGKKQEHLGHLRLCFQKCREFRLSLNLAKCAFLVKRGVILGHIISEEGVSIDPNKVEAIKKAPETKTVKQLGRFLGQIKWHNRFLRYLAHVCIPLTKLTKKDSVFEWKEEQIKAFQILKNMLTVAPVLIVPDWKLPFHIFVDASHLAVGAALMQEQRRGWLRPIYYANRVLTPAEKNYIVTERECLGMVYALQKFKHYLLANRVIFHVDHLALIYLVNKPHLSGRLARWILLLQEFDYVVIHTPGRLHVLAAKLKGYRFAAEALGMKICSTYIFEKLFGMLLAREQSPKTHVNLVNFLHTSVVAQTIKFSHMALYKAGYVWQYLYYATIFTTPKLAAPLQIIEARETDKPAVSIDTGKRSLEEAIVNQGQRGPRLSSKYWSHPRS